MYNENVANFIESLNLPKELSLVLFEDEDDCSLFFENFFMRNANVIDDLLDFRETKIKKSKKTVDLFLVECYNNMRQAFETTFYQRFTNRDMIVVKKALLSEKISLKQLFAEFQKNPNKNVLRNVL